jgi:hypothetical protein
VERGPKKSAGLTNCAHFHHSRLVKLLEGAGRGGAPTLLPFLLLHGLQQATRLPGSSTPGM